MRSLSVLVLGALVACGNLEDMAIPLPALEIDAVSACRAPFDATATLSISTGELRLPMALRNRNPWSVTPMQITATFFEDTSSSPIPVVAYDEDAPLEDVEIRLLEAVVLDAAAVERLRAALGEGTVPDAVTLVARGVDGYGVALESPPVVLGLCAACAPSCNVR